MAASNLIYDGRFVGTTSPGGAGSTTGVADVAATGNAGAWADNFGNVWSTQEGILQGVNYQGSNELQNVLMRPAAEACGDQRIVITTPPLSDYSRVTLFLVARATWGASGQWYVAKLAYNHQLSFLKYTASPMSYAAISGGDFATYTSLLYRNGVYLENNRVYTIEFSAIGSTLTVTITDVATGTAIVTTSVSDSSFATGSMGVSTWNTGGAWASRVQIYGDAAVPPYCTVQTPGAVPVSATTPVTLTGVGTTWSGATVFTPTALAGATGVSLGTPTVTSATSVTIPVTVSGATPGAARISDGATSAIVPINDSTLRVYSDNTLFPKIPLIVGVAEESVVQITPAGVTGGIPPYTFDWWRSAAANPLPNDGTAAKISTSTTDPMLLDTAPGAVGSRNFYTLSITDSTSPTPLTYNAPPACAAVGAGVVRVGMIGDSITATAGGSPYFCLAVSRAFGHREIMALNAGQSGSRTDDWLPGGPYYTSALSSFVDSTHTPYVQIMLGSNDSAAAHKDSAATYLANLKAIVADLTSKGFKVLIHQPPYPTPGAYSGEWDGESPGLVLGYFEAVDADTDLAANALVSMGDRDAFDTWANASYMTQDGIHPATTPVAGSTNVLPLGVQVIQELWAAAFVRAYYEPKSGGGGTYTDPGTANVKVGVSYTFDSAAQTGTYDGSDRWSDPGVGNVSKGTAYKANSTSNNRTGTYDPVTGQYTDPGVGNVATGVTYQFAGVTETGTLSGGSGGLTLDELKSELDARNLTTEGLEAVKLAADGLDQVGVEAGINARQALALIGAAAAGKASGLDTSAATFYAMGPAGTDTARIEATTDASGNRAATTLTPPA